MQKVSVRLLQIQLVVGILLSLLVGASPYRDYLLSVVAGATISWATAMATYLMFRRMPEVIRRKDFYKMMVVCEVTKWLVLIVLTIFIITTLDIRGFGLVMGFGLTYLGSHFLIFIMK